MMLQFVAREDVNVYIIHSEAERVVQNQNRKRIELDMALKHLLPIGENGVITKHSESHSYLTLH